MNRTKFVMSLALLIAANVAAPALADNSREVHKVRVVVSLPLEEHAGTSQMKTFGPDESAEKALENLGPVADIIQFYLPVARPMDACTQGRDCAGLIEDVCQNALGSAVEKVNFGGLCNGTCSNGYGVSSTCPVEKGAHARFRDFETRVREATGENTRSISSVSKRGGDPGCSGSDCAQWAEDSCGGSENIYYLTWNGSPGLCSYTCENGDTEIMFCD